MDRFKLYLGATTLITSGLLVKAFSDYPNFYSATIYLSQSNANVFIIGHAVLLLAVGLMYGLQLIFFGKLRPVEVEQIYERAWYAITETCLAMTLFRDEIGFFFVVMLLGLLFGKVWQWITESRVQFLQQQQEPTNPRLFHARLTGSVALSILVDMVMVSACLDSVVKDARMGMALMFMFEWGILCLSSMSDCFHYVICLVDMRMTKEQTVVALQERKREVREARERAEREAAEAGTAIPPNILHEDHVDVNDIDVPGWEGKGMYTFGLDLVMEFSKLLLYIAFFSILITFVGLPIHLVRDLYMTCRSFFKRINEFLQYRTATKEMDTRFGDATADDLAADNTCIVCRDEMRPWPTDPEAQRRMHERLRTKKLPCGHMVHRGCLRSWLERQQVCPTCRTPVLRNSPPVQTRGQGGQVRHPNRRLARLADAAGVPPADHPGDPAQRPDQGQRPRQNQDDQNGRFRVFTLGRWRLIWGFINVNPVQRFHIRGVREAQHLPDNLALQLPRPAQLNQPSRNSPAGQMDIARNITDFANARTDIFTRHAQQLGVDANNQSLLVDAHLLAIQRLLSSQINNSLITQGQMQLVEQFRVLQERIEGLNRLRQAQASTNQPLTAYPSDLSTLLHPGLLQNPMGFPAAWQNLNIPQYNTPYFSYAGQETLQAGDERLPDGMSLPPGWTASLMQPVGNTNHSAGHGESGRSGTTRNGQTHQGQEAESGGSTYAVGVNEIVLPDGSTQTLPGAPTAVEVAPAETTSVNAPAASSPPTATSTDVPPASSAPTATSVDASAASGAPIATASSPPNRSATVEDAEDDGADR